MYAREPTHEGKYELFSIASTTFRLCVHLDCAFQSH